MDVKLSETGITVKKSEAFSEWYTQLVIKSELADYAPIKGCIVFREHSYGIWEKIQEIFNEKIKRTGHKNVYFPVFIPEGLLKKEAEHFEGFVPECAWITVGGKSELEERLAIRPTSETIIYAMFSKWIRSWRDLPVKLNQWANIVRWETKATKPFLRTREFLWQEGHTAHINNNDAKKEVLEILEIYRDLIENYLAIPVLVGKKSEKEKFAGAVYTTTLEALMPDGRALQMGTSHHLGQNFAKVFEIKFVGEDEKNHYVWQTSWGVSTRLIGATVMVHGDDKGLILPPKISPIQIVVIPILYKNTNEKAILKKAKIVSRNLIKKGFSVTVDDRVEYTPGWKFNEWELKGIPLRIEIGPRDIAKKQVTLARRDTFEKKDVPEKEIIHEVEETLAKIQTNLFNKAQEFLQTHITRVGNYSEFKDIIQNKGGLIQTNWCGRTECEEKIKEETGATIRLIPFQESSATQCIYCERKGEETVFFGKAY